MLIKTTTKQQGSWSQFIEVGRVETTPLGRQRFVRLGYAQRFAGLEVEREYEGQGANAYAYWLIEVPDGFPHIIRRVTNPGGSKRERQYEVLYDPKPSCIATKEESARE